MESSEVPEAGDARRTQDLEQALHGLYAAGHYEQVLVQGRRVLEQDPQSTTAHYLVALALISLQRPRDAFLHIDPLLTAEPNWAPSHHAASLGFKGLRRFHDAWAHIQTAIHLNPEVSTYHTVAAILALHRNDLARARGSIAIARQLDPQDADIIRLAVEIQGTNQTTAREAWERIHELEKGLELDPNNAGLHASIGFIFLDELDQPREAEQSFREALRRDPADRDHQKALFRAVGQQRLVYRVLSIPARAYAWLSNWRTGMAAQPWRLLFLVVAFKAVAVFLLWLMMVSVLFWPAAKLYQWLLISEIECVAESSERHLRFKRTLNRWPFWARFLVCLTLILGFWLALFATLGIVAVGFTALAIITGIHFALTLGLWLLRKARSKQGRWAADRRRRKSLKPPPPPPLPT